MTLQELVSEFRAELNQMETAVRSLRELTGRTGEASGGVAANESAASTAANAQRLEMYKILRTEIEAIWSQTFTTLNFLLAFVGLVLAGTFSKEVERADRLPLLLVTSIVTVGGYYLIYVHTSRVWRTTTYMRVFLEPLLAGMKWETHLAGRNKGERAKGPDDTEKEGRPEGLASQESVARRRYDLDKSLFEGHSLILHCVNLALFVVMLWFCFSNEDLVRRSPGWAGWSWLASMIVAVATPLIIVGVVLYKQRGWRRGEGLEKEHLDAWNAHLREEGRA